MSEINDAQRAILSGGATELLEQLLIPESRVTGNATRVGQNVSADGNFDGASFIVRRKVTFNRVIFRITGFTAPGTLRLLIFQAAGGLSGAAPAGTSRIGTITGFVLGGTGNFAAALTEGLVTAEAGLIYVLWGRDSAAGSFTLRTYTTQSNDLLNTNVDTDTHPTSFTTTLGVGQNLPATFDPRESATVAGTAADVTSIIRFKKV